MEQYQAVMTQVARDPFTHPHSEIVRECVLEVFSHLARDIPGAWIKKKDDAETYRNTVALHLTALENPTKSTSCMYSKTHATGFGTQSKKKQLGQVNNATTSAVHALPFLKAFTGQHYTIEGYDTGVRVDLLFKEIVALFRELEPYCVFMVSVDLRHAETLNHGILQIGIILRDEFEAVRDYDFITNIRINSPALQAKRHDDLMEFIASKNLIQLNS